MGDIMNDKKAIPTTWANRVHNSFAKNQKCFICVYDRDVQQAALC